MARPSSYTPEVAATICERLAAGETLRAICRGNPALPAESTVRQWVTDDRDGFAERYGRARDAGLDAVADEIVEISDDARNDWMEREDPENPGYSLNGEHIARSRLRVDSRKWYLSKMAPKRYGEQLRLQGDPDAPLFPASSVESIEQRIMEILTHGLQRRARAMQAAYPDAIEQAAARFQAVRNAVQIIEGLVVERHDHAALTLPAAGLDEAQDPDQHDASDLA